MGYAKLGDAKLKNVVLGWDALTKDEWLGENGNPLDVFLVILLVICKIAGKLATHQNMTIVGDFACFVVGHWPNKSRNRLLLVCFLVTFHIFSADRTRFSNDHHVV